MTIKEIFKPLITSIRDLTSRQILTKSLEYSAGIESELQNPDRILNTRNKDLTLYDLMLMDDKIKSSLELFKKMALSVGGSVVSASEDEQDEEIAQFVDDTLNNMSVRWWDIFDNLMDARAYGFKCGELMWNVVDGKVVLTNIKFKHSMFFDFEYDEFADLKAVKVGYRNGGSESIPVDEFKKKFVYFVNPYLKDMNYYGESDLMSIYETWRSKTQISKFRNIYLQNYGFPIPIALFDELKMSKAEHNTLKTQLKQFQEQMFFMIPASRGVDGKLIGKIDLQFHKAETSGGAQSFSDAIDQLDKQIARKLLIPDKLGFSESAGGSYNLGENQFDALKVCIRDELGRLEDCINEQIIRPLVDYNFTVEEYPKFKFEGNDNRLTETMLRALIETGIIDKREPWIRQYAGIPSLTAEEQEALDEQKEKEQDSKNGNGEDTNGEQRGIPTTDEKSKDEKPKEEMKASIPVNFKKIEGQFDGAEKEFLAEYNKIMIGIQLDVINQIKKKKIIENKDLSLIKALRIPKTALKDLYSNYFAKLYFNGKGESVEETSKKVAKIEKQLMKTEYEEFKPSDEELWLDRAWVDKYLKQFGDLGKITKKDREYLKNYREKSFYITGETEQEVLNTVQKQISSGLRTGLTTDVIIGKIAEELSSEREKYALTIARTNSSEAYNSGRMNMFLDDKISPFIEAYQYSAIMDEATTPFCAEHDGHIIYPSDPEFPKINPPNHYNCRSLLIPIMVGDKDNEGDYYQDYDKKFPSWEKGVTKEGRKPAEGFGG